MSLDPLNGVGNSTFERYDLEKTGLSPRSVRTLEGLPLDRDALSETVDKSIAEINKLDAAPLVVWQAADVQLTDTRVIADSDNVTLTAGASDLKADLTDTGVTANSYGSAAKTVSFTVDEKGRLTVSAEFDLNTDNIIEGLAHLFFTVARARASISGTAPISYNSATGTISLDASGVTPGTYSPVSSVTVGADGRVTAIS